MSETAVETVEPKETAIAEGQTPENTAPASGQDDEKESVGHRIFTIVWWVFWCVLIGYMLFMRMRYATGYIESGSMRPTLEIGAIVWVDETAYDQADPQVGDIVMYRSDKRRIVHRITAVNDDGTFIIKGDNNDTEDFAPVTQSQIQGKVVKYWNWAAPIVRKVKHLSNV